jgi:hypothetical protein
MPCDDDEVGGRDRDPQHRPITDSYFNMQNG